MPKKTCPLCGGKLKNNYCESCGYDVPDDDEGLSAIYDMDPENDAFGEQVREIIPEVQAEEIYPNRPAGFDTAYEQPQFKVRDEEGKTVHQNYQNQTPPPPPFAGQNANNGAYGTPPNAGAQNNGGNYVPPPSPFANNGTGSPPPSPFANGGQQAFADDVKEFAKRYWWAWVLLFLLPWWLCIIVFLVFTRNAVIEPKYRRIFVLSFIAALILPPW